MGTWFKAKFAPISGKRNGVLFFWCRNFPWGIPFHGLLSPLLPGLRRFSLVVFIFCGGTLLSLLTFFFVRDWEDQKIKMDFDRAAGRDYSAIVREIESVRYVLNSIQSLYVHSPRVEWEEFGNFVRPFLERNIQIRALEWVPRLPASQRGKFERAARKEFFPGFQITEKRGAGELVRAGQREEYFPVYFVEPFRENERALGYDQASDPARRRALEQARDSGGMVATPRIKLEETSDNHEILVFASIYRPGTHRDSVAARRKNLAGFALAAFSLQDMVEKTVTYLKMEGLNLFLYDRSAPLGEQLLYHSRPLRGDDPGLTEEKIRKGANFEYIRVLPFAGRQWLFICQAGPEYISQRRTWQSWQVLIAGLLFTALLASNALNVVSRGERVERMVGERTLELEQANQKLAGEIAVRRQSEEKVLKSQEELKHLSAQLLTIQENERKRIAQELHDSLATQLAAIKYSLERKLAQTGMGRPSRNDVTLEEIISLTQNGIEEIRRIISNLRPSILDDLGILPTISWFCREFRNIYCGIQVEKEIEIREDEISVPLKVTIFRVLQEAMNNVAKHSGAGRVRISLVRKEGAICFSVEDDGQGFDPEKKSVRYGPRGLGLSSMKERVELSGGRFLLSSAGGRGTSIRAEWPADEENPSSA